MFDEYIMSSFKILSEMSSKALLNNAIYENIKIFFRYLLQNFDRTEKSIL